MFCKSAPQECPTRVSYERVPHKSVLQECSTRVSHKSECHTRCPTGVHKSVSQRFPKRMRPTRVSHKRVSYKSVCFRVRVCMWVCGLHLVESRLLLWAPWDRSHRLVLRIEAAISEFQHAVPKTCHFSVHSSGFRENRWLCQVTSEVAECFPLRFDQTSVPRLHQPSRNLGPSPMGMVFVGHRVGFGVVESTEPICGATRFATKRAER